MKINKKNIILGLEWLSFQCGEYMGDLQKDRCEISDIPQEYIDLFKDIDTGDSDTDEMGNQPIDRDKMIEEMDRKIAELVEGEVIEVPVCDICGKSGNVIEKKDSNSGNYYNICDSTECNTKEKNDGKVSCDKCGKFTDERQMNYYNAYAVCWRCDSDDDSCDECGGDGFIEYDNSSKKEGEVIESYDKEECNKCNGKGKIK
jgi:hypothetical protein